MKDISVISRLSNYYIIERFRHFGINNVFFLKSKGVVKGRYYSQCGRMRDLLWGISFNKPRYFWVNSLSL